MRANARSRCPVIVLVGHGRWGAVYAAALRRAGVLDGIVVSGAASAGRLAGTVAEPCGSDLGTLVRQTGARAVAILSPTPWHACHVRAALALGLPALVIKPVTSRAASAWRLDAEVRAAGGVVCVVHEALASPPVRVLLRAVAAGRVGHIHSATIVRQGQDRGPDGAAPRPMPEVAGENFAWLHDAVVHEATVANRLLGRRAPDEVAVTDVWASATRPRLSAQWSWTGGGRADVRYDGDPALPFRWAVTAHGSAGSLGAWAEAGRSGVAWTRPDGSVTALPVTAHGAPEDLAAADFLAVLAGTATPDETVADGARALGAAHALVRTAAVTAGWTWDEAAVMGPEDASEGADGSSV